MNRFAAQKIGSCASEQFVLCDDEYELPCAFTHPRIEQEFKAGEVGEYVVEGWAFWSVAILGALIVGFSKGGWSAIGNLSVPLLSLVMNPLAAAGLLLPVYLVSDWFGLWAYRHSFDRRVLAIMIPAGLIGVGLGWALIPWLDHDVPNGELIITGIVGGIGTLFSLYMLLQHRPSEITREAKILPGLFWGALAGFTSYISHSGAPPYQTYVQPLRLDRLTFAGTTTILFAIINMSKLVPYWINGQIDLSSLHMVLYLSVPAIAGVFIGKLTVGLVSQKTFYKVITWALLVVSLDLVGKALTGIDPMLAIIHYAKQI